MEKLKTIIMNGCEYTSTKDFEELLIKKESQDKYIEFNKAYLRSLRRIIYKLYKDIELSTSEMYTLMQSIEENSRKSLKIKDLKGKHIVFKYDFGDPYYWDMKFIVEIDNHNYCLLNYAGSYSGYIPYSIESIDEEFISAFFQNEYTEKIDFIKTDEYIDKYIDDEEEAINNEVILIPKFVVDPYLEKMSEKND